VQSGDLDSFAQVIKFTYNLSELRRFSDAYLSTLEDMYYFGPSNSKSTLQSETSDGQNSTDDQKLHVFQSEPISPESDEDKLHITKIMGVQAALDAGKPIKSFSIYPSTSLCQFLILELMRFPNFHSNSIIPVLNL